MPGQTKPSQTAPCQTVLLAAGGTGGHVFPGLATAAALTAARPDLDIAFIGTADRLESRLVPEAGYDLHTVPAMPFRKDLSALRLPLVLGRAVASVRHEIRQRNAIAAVCFGGYTSVSLALAARTTGTPLIVHEQNAVAGKANRLSGRLADVVAVTFPDAAAAFGSTPTRVTGNPVRPDLLNPVGPDLDRRATRNALREEALDAFGLDPGRQTLLVFGGSQGAQRINRALVASADRWTAPDRLQILHAAGSRTHAETAAAWDAADTGALHVVVTEFIQRMDLAYAAADVVLCRAGASSIAELTALGLPSVLVPYPYATDDHQSVNARALAATGGATVVVDGDLDAATLVTAAQPLLLDQTTHADMAAAATAFGRPKAAADLAHLVLEIASR